MKLQGCVLERGTWLKYLPLYRHQLQQTESHENTSSPCGIHRSMASKCQNFSNIQYCNFQLWLQISEQLLVSLTYRYGDRTPNSVPGRLLAICWVLIGLVMVGILTSSFATSLTTVALNNDVKLYGAKVSNRACCELARADGSGDRATLCLRI